MKPNIFQKIAFLVYILIVVLICVYFVPYTGEKMGYAYDPWEDDFSYQNLGVKSYHSNILDEGFGTICYQRFVIYLVVPAIFLCFIYKYLGRMNFLTMDFYRKKAKLEIFIFILFVSIVMGLIMFLFGINYFLEENYYTDEEIKANIIGGFLSFFVMFYIIRPMFLFFRGMLQEVS